ncbi:MAG: hypothetical protein LQ347_004922 [Umbilicaria vellea]|nr:MAG: hypothetical protein LQ347_004922 [Umbilicaria vellea]
MILTRLWPLIGLPPVLAKPLELNMLIGADQCPSGYIVTEVLHNNHRSQRANFATDSGHRDQYGGNDGYHLFDGAGCTINDKEGFIKYHNTRSLVTPTGFMLAIEIGLVARTQGSGSRWYMNDKRAMTDSCNSAALFTLSPIGQLSTASGFFSTNPGVLSQPFAPNPAIEDISTIFSVPGNVLTWSYPTFTNGVASYCRSTNGTLYAVFQDPPPANCTPVTLTALSPGGKSERTDSLLEYEFDEYTKLIGFFFDFDIYFVFLSDSIIFRGHSAVLLVNIIIAYIFFIRLSDDHNVYHESVNIWKFFDVFGPINCLFHKSNCNNRIFHDLYVEYKRLNEPAHEPAHEPANQPAHESPTYKSANRSAYKPAAHKPAAHEPANQSATFESAPHRSAHEPVTQPAFGPINYLFHKPKCNSRIFHDLDVEYKRLNEPAHKPAHKSATQQLANERAADGFHEFANEPAAHEFTNQFAVESASHDSADKPAAHESSNQSAVESASHDSADNSAYEFAAHEPTVNDPAHEPASHQPINDSTHEFAVGQPFHDSTYESAHKPAIDQPINASTYESTYNSVIDQPIHASTHESAHKPAIDQPFYDSTYESNYESTYKSVIDQPIHASTYDSTHESAHKPAIDQPINDCTYEFNYESTHKSPVNASTYECTYKSVIGQPIHASTYESTYKFAVDQSFNDSTHESAYKFAVDQPFNDSTYESDYESTYKSVIDQPINASTYESTYECTYKFAVDQPFNDSTYESAHKPAIDHHFNDLTHKYVDNIADELPIE